MSSRFKRLLHVLLWVAGIGVGVWHYAHEGIRKMMPANDELHSYDQVFYVRRAAEIAVFGETRRVQRSRMPLYPWVLSFFHQDGKSEEELFPRYKLVNVGVSIFALLGILAVARFGLGTPLAVPLTLATAFTFIVFKAVVVQPEVLFYFFYFAAFVLMVRCLRRPDWRLAAGVGAVTGLTHLTKGSVLPMLCAFLAVSGAAAVSALRRARRSESGSADAEKPPGGSHGWRIPAAAAVGFLTITAPLLWNSVRVFGNPFYDPNTKVYFWAETPNEMAALQKFDLAQQMPVLDARLLAEPLVQEFLPKWVDDPALLDRLRARVLAGESVPLSGEFDVLPSLGQWWRRHSVGEAIDRILERHDAHDRKEFCSPQWIRPPSRGLAFARARRGSGRHDRPAARVCPRRVCCAFCDCVHRSRHRRKPFALRLVGAGVGPEPVLSHTVSSGAFFRAG